MKNRKSHLFNVFILNNEANLLGPQNPAVFQKKKTRIALLFFFISFLLLSCLCEPASAQSKKDLEKKKEQLHKAIEYTNHMLEETKKNKNVSLNQLITLNKKISMREELISTITDELKMLEMQISITNSVAASLEKDLQKLKKEYAQMVVYAYRNQSAYNRLMFIFASKDFNQAYKRLKYLQQYSSYRQKQALLINEKQRVLTAKKTELQNKLLDKKKLRHNEESEKTTLSSEKNEQEVTLTSLQEKEKQLKKELREKQKAEDRLNKAIEDIIRHEIEAAKKKAMADGKKISPGGSSLNLTPEALKLSENFAGNKGYLPWPVEQGMITGTFGVHPHPVWKDIMVKNNGIDINSSKGAFARSIFGGVVTGVVVIPGAFKAIIIRHGEYLTVYSNLEEVYVKMGDNVSTKQKIGLVHTNEEESKTEVHLEIWKGTNKLDPAPWLFFKK